MKPEPPYSCPSLDSAIEYIEQARKIHDDLRNWAHDWEAEYRELEKRHSNEIEEKNEIIQSLENKIEELRDSIKALQNEISAQPQL